jgi:hypothetical protein
MASQKKINDPKYNDPQWRVAFENACDYLYYGLGRASWMAQGHNEGLSDEDSKTVWHEAFMYMAEAE